MLVMPKPTRTESRNLNVECPCCGASLTVDATTGVVLTHKAKEKPPTFQDFTEAVDRFKGEAGRREDAFKKSLVEHQTHKETLDKKFEELFKRAKEDPDKGPPKRDFDLD
jgi:hypothetical protein